MILTFCKVDMCLSVLTKSGTVCNVGRPEFSYSDDDVTLAPQTAEVRSEE